MFRFDVEICDSFQATHKEIIEKIPGKFAVFCWTKTNVNEEVIKAAGEKYFLTVNTQHIVHFLLKCHSYVSN